MKSGLLLQVRMSSTRLPGKALLPLAGAPVLQRIIERLKRVKNAELIVATSTDPSDNPIEALCQQTGTPFYRGSLQDVLGRFAAAARYYHLDTIVRLTGDCPLLDPGMIDAMLDAFHKDSYDYYCNIRPRTYPRGLDTEIFPVRFLNRALEERIPEDIQEHVVIPYINRNLPKIRIGSFADSENHSDLRWTLDEKADYELITRIYDALYPSEKIFNYRDILSFVNSHPDLKRINAAVKQKTL